MFVSALVLIASHIDLAAIVVVTPHVVVSVVIAVSYAVLAVCHGGNATDTRRTVAAASIQ